MQTLRFHNHFLSFSHTQMAFKINCIYFQNCIHIPCSSSGSCWLYLLLCNRLSICSTHYRASSLFRNRLLSRATKILLYKKLIRPIVAYGAETWTMTKKKEQALLIFEKKIFRRIHGPKYEDGE